MHFLTSKFSTMALVRAVLTNLVRVVHERMVGIKFCQELNPGISKTQLFELIQEH